MNERVVSTEMSSKVQRKDRKYKDFSAKQKARIAEKTYRTYLSFCLEQDDTFFFIAGYTPGGAPYGVTWEQMGMEYDEDD